MRIMGTHENESFPPVRVQLGPNSAPPCVAFLVGIQTSVREHTGQRGPNSAPCCPIDAGKTGPSSWALLGLLILSKYKAHQLGPVSSADPFVEQASGKHPKPNKWVPMFNEAPFSSLLSLYLAILPLLAFGAACIHVLSLSIIFLHQYFSSFRYNASFYVCCIGLNVHSVHAHYRAKSSALHLCTLPSHASYIPHCMTVFSRSSHMFVFVSVFFTAFIDSRPF